MVTELEGPWEFDRRVSNLLKRNLDDDEHIRFAIEGMGGQCIIALDERLLVVKPGSAVDATYSGLVTSIRYSAIADIEVSQSSSNRMIKIHTSDYHITEAHTGQGTAESKFFQLDDPDSIPIAKWTLKKYKPHLRELGELIREAKGT